MLFSISHILSTVGSVLSSFLSGCFSPSCPVDCSLFGIQLSFVFLFLLLLLSSEICPVKSCPFCYRLSLSSHVIVLSSHFSPVSASYLYIRPCQLLYLPCQVTNRSSISLQVFFMLSFLLRSLFSLSLPVNCCSCPVMS